MAESAEVSIHSDAPGVYSCTAQVTVRTTFDYCVCSVVPRLCIHAVTKEQDVVHAVMLHDVPWTFF
jgi:hypothetical protein